MEERLPKRSEVPEELTWRLEDIYADTSAWEADVKKGLETAAGAAALEGKLADDAGTLLHALDLYETAMQTLYRFYAYANMKHDQDTGNAENQALLQKARAAETRIAEKFSFLEPEILAILLLASAGEMAGTPSQAFGMLQNADLKFPSVKDAEGKEIRITNGRFVPLQMSKDRDLRKEVFEKFYSRYNEFRNTWAALYDGQVKQQIFFAKARKYASTFEAAVDGNNVDPAVCDRLIDSVHRGLGKMHRYVALRKKLLGVDELHMYDVYVPMVSEYTVKVTYEEAVETALKALEPLGDEYISLLRKGFENRWVDVVENEGKRGGAYSEGVYGIHPYVLLNFNGTLDDIFTLVHEMGHSLHTWYSSANQTFLNSNYKIFVAEVASTTNEVLLLEYLLKKAESREEKAYLINHYLESFKGTLYRQTMFEEFERKTNAMAEAGTPLTADTLSKTYLDLNRQYFGPEMVSDELIGAEWMRIPHFYYNFYVYQYATSFAAAVAVAHRILEEGQAAVGPYLAFLKSGCTEDPVSLLKIAGVDLSAGTPVDEALAVFDAAISEMEALYLSEEDSH